jgi:hypothetical protein
VNTGTVSYYIYYRVAGVRVSVARRAVAAMLTTLEQRTAVSGRLQQRQDEPLLWMEVYESVRDPAAFEAVLADLLLANDFESFLAPEASRKTERFVSAPLIA